MREFFKGEGVAVMEQLTCRYCKTKNNSENALCSFCNVELDHREPKISQKTGNPRMAWFLVAALSFASVLGFIFAGLASNSGAGSPSNSGDEHTSSGSQESPSIPFNGHCPGLMYAAEETMSVLAGAGRTSTVDDVIEILKKNGNLYSGYSLLVSEPNSATIVKDASNEMLQIRVGLSDGGDIRRSALMLKSEFQTIQEMCTR
jgi:hypothetical protein